MRPVRYNVAASLDGYIAGPNGEYDWIPLEPAIDFGALFREVDTVLLGRRSYELVRNDPAAATWPAGAQVLVFSRSLDPGQRSGVTIIGREAAEVVAELRAATGGSIWLYGGGALFASLLRAGQVDQVEVTLIPILLGCGVPLLPPTEARTPLRLDSVARYPSGQVSLHYTVTTAREP